MLCKYCFIFTILAALSRSISTAKKNDKTPTTIVVDPSGKGGFRTIQSAIDSVPPNNQRWITIDIKAGVYREQVHIPPNRPFIYLKGAGQETTSIVWDASANIANNTFTSEASNTLAKDIAFINSHNYPRGSNHNPRGVAVAARINGDKSAFYRCGFFGLQDTLWDDNGRHYFRRCTIKGEVDFIFGAGQSHYEDCTISVDAPEGGYITAQGRGNPKDTSGFVFKHCKIVGNGKIFLGRPWRPYARVLYYNTTMADVIIPKGWISWTSSGHEDLLTLSENKCRGPGAQSSERVKWEKKLKKR